MDPNTIATVASRIVIGAIAIAVPLGLSVVGNRLFGITKEDAGAVFFYVLVAGSVLFTLYVLGFAITMLATLLM